MATYTGTTSNDSYAGGSASDFVSGLGGNDSLSGAAGNDTIIGGANSYFGGGGNSITPVTDDITANTTTYGPAQYFETITALPDGGYVVTWNDLQSSPSGIFGQVFDATGSQIGTEFQINTSGAYAVDSVATFADSSFYRDL